MFAEPPSSDHNVQADWGLNWTDFPVMNMHPHAWPLYSAAKLLGLELHESGVNFKADLPLAEYRFTSPLLGFSKSGESYTGWYAPATAGRWNIELTLSSADVVRARQVRVNGLVQESPKAAQVIRLTGESSHGAPLRWEIS
jgi:hypothetical protein